MNPTTDKLHTLIQSMSKSEKGFFKKQSNTYSSKGGLNYLKLFDAISKQEQYDEEQLLKKFRKETFVKQFAVTKKYLFDSVLRNIRAFELDSNSYNKIDELKTDAELLVQRSLYKEALRYIKKAKKLAYDVEYLSALLDLLELERKVVGVYYPKDHTKRKKHINAERKKILQELKDLYFYIRNIEYIHGKLRQQVFIRDEATKQEFEELLANPLYADDSRATTLRAQICYWGAHQLFLKALGNTKESVRIQSKITAAWDARPALKKERPLHYFNNLCNYLNKIYQNGEAERYGEELKKLKEIRFDTPSQQILKARRIFIHELYYMNLANDYSELDKIAEAVQLFIEQHATQVQVSEHRFLLYNVMYAYVISGQFEKALDWNLQLIDLPTTKDYWDLQRFGRLFNAIIHFELGNLTLLPSVIQSVRRFLKKRSVYHNFEQLLLRLLGKADDLYFTYNSKELYQKYLTEFTSFKEDVAEKGAFQYFDAHCWIQSKIQKKSMVDIYQEQV
ncbi:MAG: hypothetical protein GY810_05595 [Aureispira sp.]|nr:hypothetical protein [Aureispira sp.]